MLIIRFNTILIPFRYQLGDILTLSWTIFWKKIQKYTKTKSQIPEKGHRLSFAWCHGGKILRKSDPKKHTKATKSSKKGTAQASPDAGGNILRKSNQKITQKQPNSQKQAPPRLRLMLDARGQYFKEERPNKHKKHKKNKKIVW